MKMITYYKNSALALALSLSLTLAFAFALTVTVAATPIWSAEELVELTAQSYARKLTEDEAEADSEFGETETGMDGYGSASASDE